MPLGDYREDTFTDGGKTRRVFRRGEGPAVVVIAEIPGITPRVVEFADRVVDLGLTAVLPTCSASPAPPRPCGRCP
jgi:dienelactone hydrolase